MQNKYILVINAGSATLKFKVFNFKDFKLVKEGIVERIGLKNSFIMVNGVQESALIKNHEQAFNLMLKKISVQKNDLAFIGHRVVHGGEKFTAPILITNNILRSLQEFNKLAPLHNPVNLNCIKASIKYLKNVPDIAVFDTAFYKTLPSYAYTYAIPYKYYECHKIRRYGFHGISHQYMAEEIARKLQKPLAKLNLITLHLGSGCSITAIKNGRAIDTSMGFTPLEGLVMSTRCGNIDPAIPLYLLRELKMTENQVSDLLNKNSGLLGLGGSMDMREILVKAGYSVRDFKLKQKISARDKKLARLTLSIFIYNIKKYIGAYSLILGNVDALAFSGGIGERSALIRGLILNGGWGRKIKNFVIPANEELMIAKIAKNFKSK